MKSWVIHSPDLEPGRRHIDTPTLFSNGLRQGSQRRGDRCRKEKFTALVFAASGFVFVRQCQTALGIAFKHEAYHSTAQHITPQYPAPRNAMRAVVLVLAPLLLDLPSPSYSTPNVRYATWAKLVDWETPFHR